MRKLKVGAVSYLNTKPLLYGIKNSIELMQQIALVEDYPANIAQMLLQNEIDIGLVPVAILPQLKNYTIVSDYCIGADGPVASVCLFSEAPLDKIEKVLLDYQSKTSVQLIKILMSDYWKINPLLEETSGDYRQKIKDTTAGLVIGDRAFEQRLQSTFSYDLAAAWKTYTGLPFVFAVWAANKKIPTEFITLFNEANAVGINELDKILQTESHKLYDLRMYYTKNINYQLTEAKKKGISLFLEKLNRQTI